MLEEHQNTSHYGTFMPLKFGYYLEFGMDYMLPESK